MDTRAASAPAAGAKRADVLHVRAVEDDDAAVDVVGDEGLAFGDCYAVRAPQLAILLRAVRARAAGRRAVGQHELLHAVVAALDDIEISALARDAARPAQLAGPAPALPIEYMNSPSGVTTCSRWLTVSEMHRLPSGRLQMCRGSRNWPGLRPDSPKWRSWMRIAEDCLPKTMVLAQERAGRLAATRQSLTFYCRIRDVSQLLTYSQLHAEQPILPLLPPQHDRRIRQGEAPPSEPAIVRHHDRRRIGEALHTDDAAL